MGWEGRIRSAVVRASLLSLTEHEIIHPAVKCTVPWRYYFTRQRLRVHAIGYHILYLLPAGQLRSGAQATMETKIGDTKAVYDLM